MLSKLRAPTLLPWPGHPQSALNQRTALLLPGVLLACLRATTTLMFHIVFHPLDMFCVLLCLPKACATKALSCTSTRLHKHWAQ